jgi:hypothetical protein
MTKYMEQNCSLDATSRSASPEVPHFLWKIEVQNRAHKSPLLIMTQP